MEVLLAVQTWVHCASLNIVNASSAYPPQGHNDHECMCTGWVGTGVNEVRWVSMKYMSMWVGVQHDLMWICTSGCVEAGWASSLSGLPIGMLEDSIMLANHVRNTTCLPYQGLGIPRVALTCHIHSTSRENNFLSHCYWPCLVLPKRGHPPLRKNTTVPYTICTPVLAMCITISIVSHDCHVTLYCFALKLTTSEYICIILRIAMRE